MIRQFTGFCNLCSYLANWLRRSDSQSEDTSSSLVRSTKGNAEKMPKVETPNSPWVGKVNSWWVNWPWSYVPVTNLGVWWNGRHASLGKPECLRGNSQCRTFLIRWKLSIKLCNKTHKACVEKPKGFDRCHGKRRVLVKDSTETQTIYANTEPMLKERQEGTMKRWWT